MEISNFQSEIIFSPKHSEKRIQSAYEQWGKKNVNRIISLALFFLGGNREQISKCIDSPVGTFYSFLNRFHRIGLKALFDQRGKPAQHLIDITGETETAQSIDTVSSDLEIIFGEKKQLLNIPYDKNRIVINSSNPLQFKTIILSFLNSGFLTVKEASEQLEISERHVRDITKALQLNDIKSLIDGRRGQQKDYIVTEDIKAEIIQQYTVNLVNEKSTAGNTIAVQVNDKCNTSLSDRAIRQHISKLGLNKIKKSLPELLKGVKKSSKI